MKRIVPILAVALAIAGCADSASKKCVDLAGDWSLDSYIIDNSVMQLDENSGYVLSIDTAAHTFSMVTDCNNIMGAYEQSSDTLRFGDAASTRMMCPEMDVEEAMLRMLNDSAACAVCRGDSIVFTAPAVGSAVFKRRPA